MRNLNLKLVLIALLIVAVGAGIVFFARNGNINEPEGQSLGAGNTLDRYRTATASTSPVYLTTSGSPSSLILSTSNAEHIDLNIMFKASTTAAVLNWKVYFSSDDGSNKNWFGEDVYSATAYTVTHASTTAVNAWDPNVITNVYKNIAITPVASKYAKVEFYVTGANGALYAEAITQARTNN